MAFIRTITIALCSTLIPLTSISAPNYSEHFTVSEELSMHRPYASYTCNGLGLPDKVKHAKETIEFYEGSPAIKKQRDITHTYRFDKKCQLIESTNGGEYFEHYKYKETKEKLTITEYAKSTTTPSRKIEYFKDNNGNVTRIATNRILTDGSLIENEGHIYDYDEKGRLTMYRRVPPSHVKETSPTRFINYDDETHMVHINGWGTQRYYITGSKTDENNNPLITKQIEGSITLSYEYKQVDNGEHRFISKSKDNQSPYELQRVEFNNRGERTAVYTFRDGFTAFAKLYHISYDERGNWTTIKETSYRRPSEGGADNWIKNDSFAIHKRDIEYY